jgi:amino acid permease
VNKVSTATTLVSLPNPSVYGQAITFTATVTSTVGTPTGSVDFYDDEVLMGAGTLNSSGEATFSTSAIQVGTHVVTAMYTGDSNYAASVGTLSPNQQVNKASTATTLVSLPNPSVYGQAITFTATVTSTVGTPTGSVDFYDDEVLMGAGTLNSSGEATFSTSALQVGTHVITATYSGDNNYAVSTGRLSSDQVVTFKVYLPLAIR